jgi:hypothetical protein
MNVQLRGCAVCPELAKIDSLSSIVESREVETESVSETGTPAENSARTDMGMANANASMAANLFGICIVILTFTIGLAINRTELGSEAFFEIVLAIVVASIYSFGLSAYYAGCWQTSIAGRALQQARIDCRKSDLTMMAGVILLSFEPVAILISLGWTAVGLVSLFLTLTFVGVVIHERRIHKPLMRLRSKSTVDA